MNALAQAPWMLLILLAAAFYLVSTAQALYAARASQRRSATWASLTVVYEALLGLHLVLGCLAMLAANENRFDLLVAFYPIFPPLEACLWLNLVVIALGAIVALRARRVASIVELAAVAACLPPVISALGPLSVGAFVFDVVVFAGRCAYLLSADVLAGRSEIRRTSIIEAVDALPEGVLYIDRSGRVVYANDTMRSCLACMGMPSIISDASGLWQRICEHRAPDEAAVRESGSSVLVRLSDSETRLFVIEETYLRFVRCDLIVAYDVTEEDRVNRAILRMSRLCEESAVELEESLRNVAVLAEAEAFARMRSRVHDVIGQRLSILHRRLEDGAVSDSDVEAMRPVLDSIMDDLRTCDDAPYDLPALVEAFGLVGLSIEVEGRLPPDSRQAGVVVGSVRECATNALKHAQAHRLHVRLFEDGGAFCFVIDNDGGPLRGELREGAGIPGMRHAVESVGGALTVEPAPVFTVSARIPLEKERS